MPTELTTTQAEQLHAALLSAFPTRYAVAQLLRYGLDQNLNELVGDVGLDEVIFKVVEWARATGRLDALVQKARDENPGNPELQQFVEQLGPAQVAPEARGRPADRATAGRGLIALQELMEDPEAQEAVREFQTEFEAGARQIELLAFYKGLHDLLHTLQFQSYRIIVHEARRFPDDELAREALLDQSLTLDGIAQQLGEFADRSTTLTVEVSWIQDLKDARRHLQTALDNTDRAELKKAVWLIERVVAVQPSQINTRLNAAARALSLPALVSALGTIQQRLTGPGLHADKLQEFEAGIVSLSALNADLQALVIEHDRWQAVDLELRRIRSNIRDDLTELELSWPRLKIMIEPLTASADAWAAELRTESAKLEAALAEQSARARNTFQRVYSQASDRFYRVDLALKRVCDNLKAIGTPLAYVLRMLR